MTDQSDPYRDVIRVLARRALVEATDQGWVHDWMPLRDPGGPAVSDRDPWAYVEITADNVHGEPRVRTVSVEVLLDVLSGKGLTVEEVMTFDSQRYEWLAEAFNRGD